MPPNSPKPRPSAPDPLTRVGLFGGSFDPVHNGHLALAQHAREQARLDSVWFIPTAVQPHKPTGPVASDAHRVAMLERAIANQPGYEVCRIEIERGGVSYTVDTLREIRDANPRAELFLLMGADTLHDLPHWRSPGEVLQLATPLVVHRPGEPAPDFAVLSSLVAADRIATFTTSVIDMPAMDISSSDIRRRVAQHEAIEDLAPAPVCQFIREEKLYQSPHA